jgi:hypothetical protein
MNSIKTQNPIALSLLINEDIYIISDIIEPSVLLIEKDGEKETEKSTQYILPTVQELPIADLIPEKPAYKYLGDNNKSILIMVNEVEADILKKDDLLALNKMLAARKLEHKDVAILNIQKNTHLSFKELKDFFGFNKLLLFGINPKDLNISGIVANQIGEFLNTPILGTWHIKQMQADEKKKLTFWTEMKKLI